MVEQIALESSGGGWVQHQVGKQWETEDVSGRPVATY